MKYRYGFISNSSSSNFIVYNAITTAELARKMIEVIEKDYLEFDERHSEWYKPAMDWLNINKEFDEPIVIPWSCNYDTWITPQERDIYIETCWNHDWDYLEVDQNYVSEDDTRKNYEATQDTEFWDLTTFKFVRRSEYKSLWERAEEKKRELQNNRRQRYQNRQK